MRLLTTARKHKIVMLNIMMSCFNFSPRTASLRWTDTELYKATERGYC